MKFQIYILLFFLPNCYSQKKDYIDYHININKAEGLFFMEQKVDSALFYYDKVFKEYDFIFVKDLINASQIAIFSKRSYKKYIERGFNYGLKLNHLDNYPLFKKVLASLKKDKKLLEKYEIGRKNYISKIDFDYLDYIYKLAIKDQNEKRQQNYKTLIHNTTDKIIDATLEKGFPGEKLIGIPDSLIFSEVKKHYLDLNQQIKNDKCLFYMKSEEEDLSAKWPLVMFVHNECTYFLYKSIFFEQLKKGNIHPRDIGLLYDNTYRFLGNFPDYCDNMKLKGVYRLNLFTSYSKQNNIEETNLMRKKLYIVSTFVDEKKKEYEIKYGFKIFSGFWNCR